MKLKALFVFGLALLLSLSVLQTVFAEDKPSFSLRDKNTPGGMIPKLPKTADDPQLFEGHVYPNWGPPCQRYTYSVIYRDKDGRKPQYVKIYFNGKMLDLEKENKNDNDYKKGVKYAYKYVPNRLGSNFYYFEASNGLGKARASIIDSPDNGPVLFASAFEKNEIAVIESNSGKKVLSFSTGKEWVGGIALSDEGKYLAAKTSYHVYLFDTAKVDKPVWEFKYGEGSPIGDDVKGGVAISADGSKIFASIGNQVFAFDKKSSKPVWQYEMEGQAYNVSISKDGNFVAAATAGDESNVNSNLLILWNTKNGKPLWQYHASGNFHDVSLSNDGQFIAGSTGCPDRRFYLFSKDSNSPLIRTEPLTRDSPVHRAKISSDGAFSAVGSESGDGAVFLFSKDKGQVWKFPSPGGSSVRALNFTPDSKYVGAATFGGNAYIFDKDRNSPAAEWKINASLGGVDIADDGSFIAAGGTDKKLYILNRDSKAKTEIPFSEYIEEVDISANGKYIAAGTGGSVYFFEAYLSQDGGKVFDCSNVTEPPSESEVMAKLGINGEGGQVNSSLCGDGKCEGPETIDNCTQDCDPKYKGKAGGLPVANGQKSGMLFLAIRSFGTGWGLGLLGSVAIFIIYLGIRKLKFLEKQKIALINLNQSKPLSFLHLNNKRIIIVLAVLASIFLALTLSGSVVRNTPKENSGVKSDNQPNATSDTNKLIQEKGDLNKQQEKQQGVCGNDFCEPGLGETKESCPKDCSAGD